MEEGKFLFIYSKGSGFEKPFRIALWVLLYYAFNKLTIQKELFSTEGEIY